MRSVRARERRKFLTSIRVLRIVRQVFHFERIGFWIEEHRPAATVGAELGVAELLRADGDAVQHAAVFAPDGVGGVMPIGARLVQQRDEARAFVARREL